MFKNYKVNLVIILLLVMFSIWSVVKGKDEISLGLDLKGGTRLVLEAVPSEEVPKVTPEVMESLHTVVEGRVNSMGIAESVVQPAGNNRLIVEIPGVSDPDEARQRLGKVGSLQFRRLDNQGQWVTTGITGKDFARAEVGRLQSGDWTINFQFNGTGAKKFATLTSELAQGRQPLAIFFDGEQIQVANVETPILDGAGYIHGSLTPEQAKEVVNFLNAGALPVNVEIIEENTVGPLLGQASIEQSLKAGLIGLATVILFMLVFYRMQGLVASIALVVYSLLTFAIFLKIGVTFTLAGIAGFILSIGMAVDANILIFERTKEEIRAGRSLWKAIEVGFDRAFPSIFDSNTTTIITCALLWWLGTGPVKGFALTLAIGVAVSMFSAITVTRTFLFLVSGAGGGLSTEAFGVSKDDVVAGKA